MDKGLRECILIELSAHLGVPDYYYIYPKECRDLTPVAFVTRSWAVLWNRFINLGYIELHVEINLSIPARIGF
jgi:hypothetical protein